MQAKWRNWVHVTKLDPDKFITPKAVEEVATSGTDALMLSGTLNVTKENMGRLLEQVASYGLPLVIEPAGPEAVIFEGVDYLFVPSVMNTTDVQWLVGKHRDWVMQQQVKWEKVVPEAYIVLNPDSAVGRVTKAVCSLDPKEVAALASVADRYFRFPIVYIKYQRNVRRSQGCEGRIGGRGPRIALLRRRDRLTGTCRGDGTFCRYHRGGQCGL